MICKLWILKIFCKIFCFWGLIKDTIICFDGSYHLVYTSLAIQKAIDMETFDRSTYMTLVFEFDPCTLILWKSYKLWSVKHNSLCFHPPNLQACKLTKDKQRWWDMILHFLQTFIQSVSEIPYHADVCHIL
jgi:hypothetical protein